MRTFFALLLSTTALGSGVAVAQEAAPTPQAATVSAAAPDAAAATTTSAANTGDTEEIHVTAQRREERLLDVPVSVSVVRGAQIQTAGVVSTRELSLVVPGLVGGQAGYSFQPSIRGISSTGTGAGDESNVALYIDDVYISAMGATAFNLANIDHVEVSKGPQGTLFGRNATGGAIRVSTRTPSFTPEGHASVSAGADGPESREVSFYGSTGLSRDVAVSLSGYYYDDDGYLKNADPNFSGDRQGSLNTYTTRLEALYTPTDRFSLTGAFDYGRTRSGVELTTTFIDNINAFKNVVGVLPALEDREVSTNEQNLDQGIAYGGSIKAAYQFDNFTLTSLTAARTADVRVSLDNDRTNLALNRNVYRINTDTISQELTLESTFAGPFSFIAGAYYFHSTAEHPFFNIYAAPISAVDPVTQLRTPTGPIALTSSIAGELTTDSYSVFGEGTYRFNDQWSLIAGVRYSDDQKNATDRNLRNPALPSVNSDGEWDHLDYRLTLNYKPDENTLLYLTNSTGFKAGFISIAAYPAAPNVQQQVRPETVDAWELGYKSRWFDRLDITASAFHYDYKDIQLTVNNALSAQAGTVGVNILQNAGEGEIEGADLEVVGRLSDHWSARFGLSWLPTAKYTSFQGGIFYVPNAGGLGATAVAGDLSGTRILRSPETTVNLGLTYATDLEGGRYGHLSLSANYFHSDSFYMVIGEAAEQPAYGLLNAEAAWTDPSGRYTFSVWGRNLTDEAYFISGLANTGGFSAVWGKPQEIGVRLSASF